MMHLDFTLADLRIIADYKISTLAADAFDGVWLVRICDPVSGEEENVELTEEQMCALAALMIGGDSAIAADLMRAAIEEKIRHLPANLRPIP